MCFWREIACSTGVVAKQAETTKVKNKFVNAKEKFKRILSCLLSGSGKVQFRRKRLGDNVQAKSSNLPCRFCSNSVDTPLEFAPFRSGVDPKYSRTSAFWFFPVHNHGFYGVPNTFCHFHADRQLVTKKEITIKINVENVKERSWPSGLISAFIRRRPGFNSQRG